MGSLGLGNGSLRMDDVYLEGATPDGPAVVGHLSVIVDTEGITFLGPEPGERRTVGWERPSPLEFGAPAALPGGEQGTCAGVRGRRSPVATPRACPRRDPGTATRPAVRPELRPVGAPAHLAEPPVLIDARRCLVDVPPCPADTTASRSPAVPAPSPPLARPTLRARRVVDAGGPVVPSLASAHALRTTGSRPNHRLPRSPNHRRRRARRTACTRPPPTTRTRAGD